MLFVTGATAKSGQPFIERLQKDEQFGAPDSVRIFTRSPQKLTNVAWQIASGDLDNLKDLTQAMSGCDTIMHIAGIRYSRNVIEAARQNGIRKLIFVHTTGIFSKYKSASAFYKEIESEVRETAQRHNMQLTILRPTMIYGTLRDGNISIFIKMVDKLKIFPVVDHARFALQPVYCEDLGLAYYQVLKNLGRCLGHDYDLSGKEPILLIDILKTIADGLGRRPLFVSVPFPLAYAMAWSLFVASFGRYDLREKVQRLVEPRIFSHEKAKQDFGYDPVNFQQGVAHEVTAYISGRSKACH